MFNKTDLLDEMIIKTNNISPSFCMAKWMHATIHLDSGLTQSCHLPDLHPIPAAEIENNFSALHNTHFKKLQRQKMLNGIRPSECSVCWAIEDLPGNQISDRLMRSVDRWTLPYFEIVPKLNWQENINPSYLEVSFSKSCNMKCSYCSPKVSSAWETEIKTLGPYFLSNNIPFNSIKIINSNFAKTLWLNKNIILKKIKTILKDKKNNRKIETKNEENIYTEAFWKWWPSLVPDLMYFRITGGEPLLSKNTFQVLDWVNNNPQPHLGLSINSNLQVPDKQWNQFLNAINSLEKDHKIKSFMLHTSIDSYGQQAEYIRNGLNFNSFEKNLEIYLEKNPDYSAAIMCTFNNLSVVGFRKFIDWVIGLRKKWGNSKRNLYLDLPHLQEPFHQSLAILTEDYRIILEEDLAYLNSRLKEGYIFKSEIIQLERVIEWMKQNSTQNQQKVNQARKDFYLFFREHDKRRNTNFLVTFPEMEQFWQLCMKE